MENDRPDMTVVKQQIIAKLDEAFEQIATDLNISIDIVRNIAHRCRPRLTKGERKNREHTVQQLREQDYANPDIADALGMSLFGVMHIIKKLLSEGKIDPRPCGNFTSKEELDERKRKVIELRQKGCSREEIAAIIGMGINAVKDAITELIAEGKLENFQSVKEKEVRERKKKIFALCEAGCTNDEISKALGLPYCIVGNMVHQLIRDGAVKPHARRKSTK